MVGLGFEPVPQDGRCRRDHGAMAADLIPFCLLLPLSIGPCHQSANVSFLFKRSPVSLAPVICSPLCYYLTAIISIS